MCYSPSLLLCKKIKYKGVDKHIIFWNTCREEYYQGFASVSPSDNRLSHSFYDKVRKYNLTFPIEFNIRIELPCRKCLECTKSRAREWSLRCTLEASQFQHNYFVTLTYNPKYLPYNRVHSLDADSDYPYSYVPTLKKEHCFSFMKHLRTIFKREFNHDGIRFFMCGEYGTKTLRPHYHYNLFNLPLNDLSFIGTSKTGYPLYRSKILERCWKYGFVYVSRFSIETARYTAQYCCKKLNKRESLLVGRDMEFLNMSRMPAIGSFWFLKNCDKILSKENGLYCDDIFIPYLKNGKVLSSRFRTPKAFYRKLLPVTDSKRGLDTDFTSDLPFVLNKDNVFLFDAYQELKQLNACAAETSKVLDMQKYGFLEDFRYTSSYLEYLDIKKILALSKFPIIRDSC